MGIPVQIKLNVKIRLVSAAQTAKSVALSLKGNKAFLHRLQKNINLTQLIRQMITAVSLRLLRLGQLFSPLVVVVCMQTVMLHCNYQYSELV